jgi:hypothetical protein
MTLSGEGSPPLPAVVSFTDAKDPLEEEVEAPKGKGKGKAKAKAKAKAQAKPKVAPPCAVTPVLQSKAPQCSQAGRGPALRVDQSQVTKVTRITG